MPSQLKEALINAGVISQKDIVREKVKEKHMSKSAKMQTEQIRIVCEVCGKTAPDVERYQHKNKRIESKEWLCIPCADEYCIDDQVRMTNQSTHARTKVFRRQYGRTKRF